MSRYVIKNASGHLYSGNEVEGVWEQSKSDPSRNEQRFLLTPAFKTDDVLQALKFESAQDATAMLTHADLKDPAAFAGCAVMEVEFDRQDPQGQRVPA